MEEKTYPFEVKSVTEEGTFEGYAAIFNKPDLLNEVIETGAFTKSIKEKKTFPMLWYHDARIPLGTVNVEQNEKGLKVSGEFDLNVQAAREKHSLMKKQVIRGLSFGFNTIKDAWKDGRRFLKELKLFEVSPVTFQAHPEALVMRVKQLDNDTISKKSEPPVSTQVEGKSIFSPIIEGLEKSESKPQSHLFGTTIETLEQN